MPFDVIDQEGNVVDYGEGQTVRSIILYDIFDASNREVVDLVWVEDKPLSEYLDGLPLDLDWTVTVMGKTIAREYWPDVVLRPTDILIVGLTPNKLAAEILGVIALIVISYFSFGAGAALAPVLGLSAGAISSAIVAVGGLLVTTVISMIGNGGSSSTNQAANKTDSSFGLDGPKNTSDETLAVPKVYGTVRVAGNKANLYIENNPDKLTQTAFIQYILNDGEIDNVSNILINDQPIEQFTDSVWDWRPGTQNQPPMMWFSDTIVPINIQARLTTTAYQYTTSDEVDRIRLDFEFPQGLYSVDPKSGNLEDYAVAVGAGYRLAGTNDPFVSFDQGTQWAEIDGSNGTTGTQAVLALRFTILVEGNNGEPNTAYSTGISIRIDGSGPVVSPGDQGGDNIATGPGIGGGLTTLDSANFTGIGIDTGVVPNNYAVDASGVSTYTAGSKLVVFEANSLTYAIYDFVLIGNGTIVKVEGLFDTSLIFIDSYRGALRKSVTSPPLARGYYEINVLRANLESTNAQFTDQLDLVDVNEIRDDVINYTKTAYLGVQLRIGDQLNSEPQITSLVRGCKVNIYGRDGSILSYAWSNNPADVALDILLNPDNRFSIDPSRIDYVAFDNWRTFCNQQNIQFNGVFSTVTNVWDAMSSVMLCGHAGPTMQGLRYSVLIEGPADPVMMFTQDNIIKDTFSLDFTGRKGRSNLIEIQYLDPTDLYRQHSVFALDDTFVSQGDALIQSTIQLLGCTSAQQAVDTAALQLNLNRYLCQSCTFDVYLQAMGCIVGDVVLVQHDMPAWGYSSRIISVNGSTITIDSDIPFNNGNDWHILLMRSAALIANGNAYQISGSQITVTGLQNPSFIAQDSALQAYSNNTLVAVNPQNIANEPLLDGGIQRIMVGGQDYEVLDTTSFNTYFVFTVDRPIQAAVNTPVQMFKIDLLCDGTIGALPASARDLTITGWADKPGNPQPGDRIMIGEIAKYRKPFRITSISSKKDFVRTLEMIEYNDSVYGPNAHPTPSYTTLTAGPYQVLNLRAQQDTTVLAGGAYQYAAHFYWDRPLADPRVYNGARLYLSLNYGTFNQIADVGVGVQDYAIQANLDDVLRLKVVAHEASGETASYSVAPMAAIQIGAHTAKPDGITGLAANGGILQITVSWEDANSDNVKAYQINAAGGSEISTSSLVWQGAGTSFTHTNLAPEATFYYWLRTVSPSGAFGDWDGPVYATTQNIITSDLQAAIDSTAAYAQSIVHPNVVDTLPSSANDGSIVFLTTDKRLYQYSVATGTWTPLIAVVSIANDGKLTSDQIASITAAQIGGQLTSDQITSLQAAKIAGQLTPAQISSISATQITGQLTSAQIASINAAQVSGVLQPNQIPTISFSNISGQLTSSQISSIGASQVGGQLTSDQIASLAAAKVSGQLTAAQIASIASTQITGQLTAGQIASLTAAQLTGQITGTQIANGTISTANLAAGSITTALLAAGAVTASTIAAGAITATSLAVGSVTANALAANAVTAGSIAAGAITATKLAAGSVTAQSIAAGAVTASSLTVGSANNLCWNSCWEMSGAGWNSGTSSASITTFAVKSSSYASTWALQGYGSGALITSAHLTSGNNAYVVYDPNSADSNGAYGVPWNGAQAFECQAMLIPLGIAAYVDVQAFDGNGTVLATYPGNRIAPSSATAGLILPSYIKSGVIATPPATTARLRPIIYMLNDGGGDIPSTGHSGADYLWFTQFSIGAALPNQTQLSNWAPGGVTSISGDVVKTGTLNANRIVAASITAGQIAAGTITAGQIAANTITGNNILAGTITAANIAANSISTGQLAAGSITTPLIAAGAVTAQTIAAGAITTTALAVGSSTNLIWNPSCSNSNDGWTLEGNAPSISMSYDYVGFIPIGEYGCGYVNSTANVAVGTYMGAHFNAIPCSAGDWLEGQIRIGVHRMSGYLRLRFLNAAGTVIQDGPTSGPVDAIYGGGSIDNYGFLWVHAQAPAGSNAVQLLVYAQNNNTASNGTPGQAPYLFWCRASCGPSVANATTPQPYQAGGVSTITGGLITANSITTRNLAAGSITAATIAANAITTAAISAGAVTAQTIAAGAITAAKLSVGSSSNLCWNSCWELSSAGWNYGGPAGFTVGPAKVLNPTFSLPGFGSGGMSSPHMSAGTLFQAAYDPNYADSSSLLGISWASSTSVECQAQIIALGCAGWVVVQAIDGTNGKVVGTYYGNRIAPSNPANGIFLSNYNKSVVLFTPPAGTFYLRAFVQGFNDGGSDIPTSGYGTTGNDYLFFTQFSLGAAYPNQTTASDWTPGGVTTISGDMIKTGTLNANRIVASSITAGQIAAGAITATQIAAGTITAYNIAANSITAGQIAANTITAGQIAVGAIGADQIAANSIHSNMLASNFVLTNQAQIGNAIIGTAQIQSLSVGSSNISGSAATQLVTAYTGSISGPNANYSFCGVTIPDTTAQGVILFSHLNLEYINSTPTSPGGAGGDGGDDGGGGE